MRFRKKHGLILALPLALIALFGLLTWQEFRTGWGGPDYVIADGPENDGCWEIVRIVLERGLFRYSTGEVLETRPVLWSEISVLRVNATRNVSQMSMYTDKLPPGPPVPHGQTGTVDLGDVACTGHFSQYWVWTPRDNPEAQERYRRGEVWRGDDPVWNPPIVVALVECWENGRCTDGSDDKSAWKTRGTTA